MKSRFIITLCALAALCLTSRTLAQTTSWIGTNGNWSNASNWSNGVPTSADAAIFNSVVTTSVDAAFTMSYLEFNGGAQTLTDGGGSLNVINTISYAGGSSVTIDVAIVGGSLFLNGGTGSVTLNPTVSGSNTFSGSTEVYAGGTLFDGKDDSLSAGSDLYIGGGGTPGHVVLAYNETIRTLGDVNGGEGTLDIATGKTLTIQSNAGAIYTGIITGGGNLQKNGNNVQTLAGANTYTGATTINNTSTIELGNGALIGSLATSLVTGIGTLEFDEPSASSTTLSAPITGSLSVTTIGNGDVTLSGNNTYTGPTTVTNSILKAGSATAFGSGSDVTLTSSTLDLNGNSVSAGSLTADSASMVLLGNNTLTLTSSSPSAFNGSMTGAGSLVLNGGGEFEVLSALTFTGGTTIGPSGYLSLGVNSAPGASMVGNFVDNGTFQIAPYTAENFTINGSIMGTGQVRIEGAGTVTLGHGTGNTYSGITDLDMSTLTDSAANSFSPNSDVYIGSNGSLVVTQNETVGGILNGSGSGPVSIASGMTLASMGTNYVNDFLGVISGAGKFSVAAGVQGLGGNNTYSGGTFVGGSGELFVSSNTALGTGTATFDNGAEFSPDADVTLSNNIVLMNGEGLDNDDGGASNMTLNGVISESSGSGSIVWCTIGTLTLNGANTFTGGVDMREGNLVLGNNSAAGSGTITLNNTSSLNVVTGVTATNPLMITGSNVTLTGSGTIAAPVVATTGVVIAPAASPGNGPGNLTFAGGLNMESGSLINFNLYDATGSAGTGYGLITATGGLDLTASAGGITLNVATINTSGLSAAALNFNGGTPYTWTFASSTTAISGFNANQFNINTSSFVNSFGSGSFFVTQVGNNLDLNFTPVPEPSTWCLVGAGALALLPVALRRRRLMSA